MNPVLFWTIWVSYRTVKNTQTNLWDNLVSSIYLRTLGHLDHCSSQSSANNVCLRSSLMFNWIICLMLIANFPAHFPVSKLTFYRFIGPYLVQFSISLISKHLILMIYRLSIYRRRYIEHSYLGMGSQVPRPTWQLGNLTKGWGVLYHWPLAAFDYWYRAE